MIKGSSLIMIRFPNQDDIVLNKADIIFDPALCVCLLNRRVLELAFLLKNMHINHSRGTVSTARTEKVIFFLEQDCRRVVKKLKT